VILSDLSIKKPVFAWMLMIGLDRFRRRGLSDRMGVSQLPDVDFPVLTVSIDWEGAAPEVMETEDHGRHRRRGHERPGDPRGVLHLPARATPASPSNSISPKTSTWRFRKCSPSWPRPSAFFPGEVDPAVVSKSNPEDQPILWLAVRGQTATVGPDGICAGQRKRPVHHGAGRGRGLLGGYVEPNLRVWLDAEKLRARELGRRGHSARHRLPSTPRCPRVASRPATQELNVRVMGEAATVEEFRRIILPRAAGRPSIDHPDRRRRRGGGRFGRRAADFPVERRFGRGVGHPQTAGGERRVRGQRP
jgi:hypothetical protein